MKKAVFLLVLLFSLSSSLTSCREVDTEAEEIEGVERDDEVESQQPIE